ncbi:MAG: YfiR family protein [Planctomycetota bacterium]
MILIPFATAFRARAFVATPLRPHRMLRAALWLVALLALTLAFHPPQALAMAASSRATNEGLGEYEVKAQFLLRFATTYVKWPETAFASKSSPFIVAVIGKDPFGKPLDELLKDKLVGEHPIKVVRFASSEALANCHMLFVPESAEKQLKKISAFCKDKPILVVAESISAAQSGAHFGLFLEKSKLKFAINPMATRQAKLEVSSELLKLAVIVENKSVEEPR